MNPTDGYEAFELTGVVFPIRFDDYLFNGWQHHRRADVLSKNAATSAAGTSRIVTAGSSTG
jgi:hypothetical protein